MVSAVHTPSQLTNITLWPLDFGFSIFILVSIYHFANNTPKPWSTKYFSCSTRLYTTDYWLLIRFARTRTRKAFVGRFHKVRLDIYFKPRPPTATSQMLTSKWPGVPRFVIRERETIDDWPACITIGETISPKDCSKLLSTLCRRIQLCYFRGLRTFYWRRKERCRLHDVQRIHREIRHFKCGRSRLPAQTQRKLMWKTKRWWCYPRNLMVSRDPS